MKTNEVQLAWEPRADEEYITHFNLYVRHDFPPGMPRTNAPVGYVMDWHPPQDTNGWSLLTTITNLDESRNVMNVTNVTVASTNLAMFFVLTANNEVAESFFSNLAWKPAIPSQTNRLWILSLD